jgi:Rieske 2Fe-2S family protein
LFVCLADTSPDFDRVSNLGVRALDNWPMRELVKGHTWSKQLACNWKIFWENYNECLHCPGIHPDSPRWCRSIPGAIWRRTKRRTGARTDPHDPALKDGARSWTMNGNSCGPEFPDLTDTEREAGQTFVTLLPGMFVVAHVDYVRAVSLRRSDRN